VPLPRGNDRPLIRIEAERTFAARRVMPHDPRDLSFALMPWLVLDEAPRGR
jgi:hypothetical protein